MHWRDRITVNPQILVGKPAIRGTRISVELVLDFMAGGSTEDDILQNFPHLCRDDLQAVLAYAADLTAIKSTYPMIFGDAEPLP